MNYLFEKMIKRFISKCLLYKKTVKADFNPFLWLCGSTSLVFQKAHVQGVFLGLSAFELHQLDALIHKESSANDYDHAANDGEAHWEDDIPGPFD